MELMKIGELAEKSGIPISTIRHYLDLKLLQIAQQTEGGHYLFNEETLERIEFIRNLLNKGWDLGEIKEYLDPNRKQKRIIIVDDEKNYAKVMEAILSKMHSEWKIKIVTNVFDAGHVLMEFMPDLVILDIGLPGMEGNDICKFIKNNKKLKFTKVLAVTSNDTEESRRKMLQAGADAYMPKLMELQDILNKIDELFIISK